MKTRGMAIACALLVTLALAVAGRASVGPIEQPGVFALLGGTSKIVSKFWAVHGSGLAATLKVRQFQSNGTTPILKYDTDMQKTMHMVIVRDDFATFAHLHPDFDLATGTFSVPFTKAANHRYYVYADTVPHGIGQQVFRFTMESDGPVASATPSLAASSPNAKAGPYTVILAKTTVPANQPQMLDLTITKGDDPAQDLVPYLGAAAHCVFINTSTLQYVHVHPMLRGSKPSTMSSMTNMEQMESANLSKTGPFMTIHLPALPAGSYKTWLQFKSGASQDPYTAAFTVVAQ